MTNNSDDGATMTMTALAGADPAAPFQTASLNANWLDTGVAANYVYIPNDNSTSATFSWGYSYPAKIRLTLSDVLKLRALAKKDKALKAILQKFTPHIELVVDFE